MTDKPNAAAVAKQRFQETYEALQADIAGIEAQTKPLREQRDALAAQIQPIEDEMRKLARQYRDIEAEHGLFDMKMQLGAMSKVIGGKSLQTAGEPEPVAEEQPETTE